MHCPLCNKGYNASNIGRVLCVCVGGGCRRIISTSPVPLYIDILWKSYINFVENPFMYFRQFSNVYLI